jgi:nucleotide-binding universal stress UspA family protein
MGKVPRTVLLATDGSPEMAGAFRAAAFLAREAGAAVHLVHVWPYPSWPVSMMPVPQAYFDAMAGAGRFLLTIGTRMIAEFGGTVAATHLLPGRPATEIAALAVQLQADLLLLGQHRHGRFRRYVALGVAGALLREAPCPLLLFGSASSNPPTRIVIVDTASSSAAAAARLAVGLAELADVRVHRLRLDSDRGLVGTGGNPSGDAGSTTTVAQMILAAASDLPTLLVLGETSLWTVAQVLHDAGGPVLICPSQAAASHSTRPPDGPRRGLRHWNRWSAVRQYRGLSTLGNPALVTNIGP